MTNTSTTPLITPADRFFVAGHRGMAGGAIVRALQRAGYGDEAQGGALLTASREELDLLDGAAVAAWFAAHQPTVVVLAAAKVGGIAANSSYPADFLLDNLKIQNNVIENAWRSGVRRLLFLGSSCIYPKFAEQPIREEALLTGALEPTNEWYAIAKIAGIKLCAALRIQHGFDAISLMPTNLYGPGDNYHPTNSHVLPALIRRFHEAALAKAPCVTCWGTGTPLREFLHVDDLGEACVFALERWQPGPEELQFLNVGTGVDLTIRELAEAVAAATGFNGSLEWDTTKPDGTPKKQLDVSRLAALGWHARIPLAEGLAGTVAEFAALGSTRL
ncbi:MULTISPECIES: GDP-L-fucose synthase family protein [Synechococcales]|uniref:GDP-L-fucose synthase family protein n=1 Tax=Synechococcus sp. CS-1333 TaxID=2848638 RepID=UPI00223C4BB2|nr:GDP-L-fucose synthase [Synechococcus sp. CS-1333]MCT0209781.1 GDP-L-fucose synthase [Synechococcus sp. CS-1333]